MDSLDNLLKAKNFQAPDEVDSLKNYVLAKYQSVSTVRLRGDALILSVPNSALAATLHLNRDKITQACGLTKKLVIRTGS